MDKLMLATTTELVMLVPPTWYFTFIRGTCGRLDYVLLRHVDGLTGWRIVAKPIIYVLLIVLTSICG